MRLTRFVVLASFTLLLVATASCHDKSDGNRLKGSAGILCTTFQKGLESDLKSVDSKNGLYVIQYRGRPRDLELFIFCVDAHDDGENREKFNPLIQEFMDQCEDLRGALYKKDKPAVRNALKRMLELVTTVNGYPLID